MSRGAASYLRRNRETQRNRSKPWPSGRPAARATCLSWFPQTIANAQKTAECAKYRASDYSEPSIQNALASQRFCNLIGVRIGVRPIVQLPEPVLHRSPGRRPSPRSAQPVEGNPDATLHHGGRPSGMTYALSRPAAGARLSGADGQLTDPVPGRRVRYWPACLEAYTALPVRYSFPSAGLSPAIPIHTIISLTLTTAR